jgi:hypothetical protein
MSLIILRSRGCTRSPFHTYPPLRLRLARSLAKHRVCELVGSSVVDPDPDWIRIQVGPWIRIRIQEGKNDPQK